MDAAEPQPGPKTQNPLSWIRNAPIVNQGTKYSFTPFVDDPEGSLRDHLADAKPIDKEIYVFDLLQRTRATGLNPFALQILLNALLDSYPQNVQDKVGLHMSAVPLDGDTGAVIGQPDWFSQTDEVFDEITREQFFAEDIPPLASNGKEFIFWVVNGGTPDIPYYVTLILCYGKDNRMTHWGGVDALSIERRSETLQTASERLQRLLEGPADFLPFYQVWVPPYQDGEEFASGLVAYSAVAQLLDRVSVLLSRGSELTVPEFFGPMRPCFNPDAVRAESLGRAAMKAMEKLNWKARLALFPVQPFADGQREDVNPIELAPLQTPPILHLNPPAQKDFWEQEPKVQDAASQTVKPPGPPEAPVVQPDQGQTQPGGNSSSSSSTNSEPDVTASQNYINAKAKELATFKEELTAAEKACRECADFTERLLTAVLDEAKKKMIHTPSAYAVERLFWLVRRATERTQSVERQIQLLRICSTSTTIHDHAMTTLEIEESIVKTSRQIYSCKGIYMFSDTTLKKLHAARKGKGEAALVDDDVVAGTAGGGKGPAKAVGGTDKNPRKRKYHFETTSTRDKDGQAVYTMNVHRKPRKFIKKAKGVLKGTGALKGKAKGKGKGKAKMN
ncbi:hypothetical protein F4803DRAFT_548307 [Xylaria telfairii]|nr:hypothetical protein F4803DRAFT_548307 [Xylaria telfairii]